MSNQKTWDGVEGLLKEYEVNSPKPEIIFPPDFPIIGTVSEDDIIKIVSLNEIDNERKRAEDGSKDYDEDDSTKELDLPTHEVFDEIKDIIGAVECYQ